VSPIIGGNKVTAILEVEGADKSLPKYSGNLVSGLNPIERVFC
jgi:hypothetical protein